jgi:serine protease Do
MEEKNKIIEEEVNIKKEENFFKSKVFLTMCSFVVGATVMFAIILLTTKTPLLVKKITSENIKTTTLEEMSDLKTGINNVYDSAVYIEVNERANAASGSGFVYKKDSEYGYILTNYHVIEGGNKYTVTFTDGTEVEATLLGGDEYYDVAVLRVPQDKVKKVATLGDSSYIEIGDTVFTVGSPLGKEYVGSITKGIISGVNRKIPVKLTKGTYIMEVVQTDASMNNGNSGGSLCNIKGEVIGITSSKLIGSGVEGMGFAIPINTIKELLDGMESGTELERPYIGVEVVDLTNTFALQYYYNIRISNDVEFGAVLSTVEEKMPASIAGLEVGDVIIELDGEKVNDVTHFKYLLYKHKVGDKINVKYYRENKIKEATIELTKSTKSE